MTSRGSVTYYILCTRWHSCSARHRTIPFVSCLCNAWSYRQSCAVNAQMVTILNASKGVRWHERTAHPREGSSSQMRILWAALCASMANQAALEAWSGCGVCRLPTTMWVQPMVSTLNSWCWMARLSSTWYSLSSSSITCNSIT